MNDCTQEWVKAELSEGKEPEIPVIGQSVVLYLCPRNREKCWWCDIGSLYVAGDAFPDCDEPDALLWESAFGIQSGFDGVKFEDILKDYEICFAAVPPLEAGRFPSPLGIEHRLRATNYHDHINQVLEDLK